MASVGRAPYKKSRRFVFHKINDLALEREPISLFCYLSVSPISVCPLFSPLPHPQSLPSPIQSSSEAKFFWGKHTPKMRIYAPVGGTQPASPPRNSCTLTKNYCWELRAHGHDFQGPECEGRRGGPLNTLELGS